MSAGRAQGLGLHTPAEEENVPAVHVMVRSPVAVYRPKQEGTHVCPDAVEDAHDVYVVDAVSDS